MASRFTDVPKAKGIEVFELVRQFKEDPHPDKVNLSVGGKYMQSKPTVHQVKLRVKLIEKEHIISTVTSIG